MTLLIKNAKIFTKGTLINKNIFVENEKIRKITNQNLMADKVINAKNKIVLPGIIDSHVHFREPGLTGKEDFYSGSRAAASGGITTILDMPNTNPPTTTVERLKEKRRLAKKSVVNYGFHFGSTSENIEEIKNVKNVASVKIYMEKTTGDLIINDDEALKRIFSLPITKTIHAEGGQIKKALELGKDTLSRLYFCHVSSKEELNLIIENKKNNVFIEIAPHHLFLSEQDKEKQGSFAEMKPSLKVKEDQIALWEAIKNNRVDTIATDHAPHTVEEKHQINYPYGVPGCETILPLLLNAVNDGLLEIKKLVQLCCENPAKIFKLKGKGFIEEGFDADLTIIDMDLEKEVNNDSLFTKCKWSPFNGMSLKGWPVITIVNGNVVYNNGNIEHVRGKEVEYN
ncbi:dihydroorotase family protein [Candidatus Woesearchaeota archaeon]|nr:dihydroorotase family protein [Candidatus Woesearchaeota archaeon]